MKLSKAQQDVVDKMQEGWELKKDGAGYYLYNRQVGVDKVRDSTAKRLWVAGIICPKLGPEDPYAIFQLTEKYRNVVRSNPQAAYYAKLAKQEVIKRSGMSNSEIVKVSTQPKKIKK
jgi:hypothetical protein